MCSAPDGCAPRPGPHRPPQRAARSRRGELALEVGDPTTPGVAGDRGLGPIPARCLRQYALRERAEGLRAWFTPPTAVRRSLRAIAPNGPPRPAPIEPV